MAEFYLRDIPDPLWKQAKRRATEEGHSLKWLLLKWLAQYAAGAVTQP
jgi:hypothetical protein